MEEESREDMIFYAGCHGLMSIVPYSHKTCMSLSLSVRYNPQRFNVWGTISLSESVYKGLLSMLKDGMAKECLNLIKQSSYNFPAESSKQFQRFMKKIPNDELDPYWYGDDT